PGGRGGAHEPVTGVGDAGHARVGDHHDESARACPLDEFGGAGGLVVLVVGNHLTGDLHAEAGGEVAEAAGIVSGDDIGCRQLLPQPQGGVGGVSDGGGSQGDHSSSVPWPPALVTTLGGVSDTVTRAGQPRERLLPEPFDSGRGWVIALVTGLVTAVAAL